MEGIVHIDDLDLASDPLARRAVKDEVVWVEFAAGAGALQSAVGLIHYEAGDALLTGSTRDHWCVSRARFELKYVPEPPVRPGAAGAYRNRPVPVLVKRMTSPFSVARCAGGDVLQGAAGDWLLEYTPGDHGIVARARFDAVYRLI